MTGEELIHLADKSNAFARDVIGDWEDTFAFDANGFQFRYLYSNAYRSAVSAQAFWMLHLNGRIHESKIIARTLLERIVNGRVAALSPERACSLLATDRFKARENVRKLINFDAGTFDTPEIQAKQAERQDEIDKFLKLAGRTEVVPWNFADMCKEAKIEWAYRMLYTDLSEYTHASHGTAPAKAGDEVSETALYLALVAPMDTATQYDLAFHGKQRDDLFHAYKALYSKIADPILGKKAPPPAVP